MTAAVSNISMIFMVITCMICFLLPVGLFIYFKKKNADIVSFFVGAFIMIVFVMVFEAFINNIVLHSAFGTLLRSHIILYAIYGGLMAAVFEETGRYIAYRTVLKKHLHKDINALMYGAGHGGCEAIAIVGLAMINNIIIAQLINSGQINQIISSLDANALQQTELMIQTLIATPSYMFLAGGIERISAMIAQIGLSVLVWYAVKKRNQKQLFVIALLLHFLLDAMTVLLSFYLHNAFILELIILLAALYIAYVARKIWHTHHEQSNEIMA